MGPVRVFVVKLIALIPYYERDLIIIKRGGYINILIQGQKGKSIETIKGFLNIL